MSVGSSIRIYDLAKELKQNTKRVIEDLRREGADVSVPSHSVSKELADKVRNKYFPKAEIAPKRAIRVLRRETNSEIFPITSEKTTSVRQIRKLTSLKRNTTQPTLGSIQNENKDLIVKAQSNSPIESSNGVSIVDLKVDCQECLKPTQHDLLHSTDMPNVEWNEKYQVVQCMKCETLSFRRIIFTNYEEKIDLYPSRIKGRKKLHLEFIPPTIEQIYGEIHLALSNKLLIIATTGMRTLIELICKNQNSKAKNLKDKIDDLVKMHLLTLKNANNLHKLRDFGNDAAHDANIQSENTLNKCMDIIEHLLKDIYYPEIST